MFASLVSNVAFYAFTPVRDLAAAKESWLRALAPLGDAKGTILLAPEGINLNLASAHSDFLTILKGQFKLMGLGEENLKLSYSKKNPFRTLKIKLKKEIVTLGAPEGVDMSQGSAPFISAKEFAELLENPGDTYILDNRNDFEFEMGTFKGAIPAGTHRHRELAEKATDLPKDRPIVMFCTGGIRCEKLSAYMMRQGYTNIRQLKGGVLKYFEEVGGKHFEGNCFVFDERLALNPQLKEWDS